MEKGNSKILEYSKWLIFVVVIIDIISLIFSKPIYDSLIIYDIVQNSHRLLFDITILLVIIFLVRKFE